jgi:hypothetical protein
LLGSYQEPLALNIRYSWTRVVEGLTASMASHSVAYQSALDESRVHVNIEEKGAVAYQLSP